MIVVFDTSVWISAMHFERRMGTPVLALEQARNRDTLGICDAITDEIQRVLTEKFNWELSAVQERLGYLLARSLRVKVSGALRVCRDPNDDMVLECALLSGAQAIVAGDKDLLTLGSYKQIRILTPSEYLALER
jgi:putative PIN family toxin of toxin-antitoxin system